eukprot:GHVU01027196.1.p1 GENE.GHVU01027196.1~~GHVU01027196.1.p1  ORF type:complete len:159 (-),score=13.22 GHVU01027196.1:118-594(-)
MGQRSDVGQVSLSLPCSRVKPPPHVVPFQHRSGGGGPVMSNIDRVAQAKAHAAASLRQQEEPRRMLIPIRGGDGQSDCCPRVERQMARSPVSLPPNLQTPTAEKRESGAISCTQLTHRPLKLAAGNLASKCGGVKLSTTLKTSGFGVRRLQASKPGFR